MSEKFSSGTKTDKLKQNQNKKCFRNIYAVHGAKFRFIFSVEAKPVRSKYALGIYI